MSKMPGWARVELSLPIPVCDLVEEMAEDCKMPVGALATVIFLQGLADQMTVNKCGAVAEGLSRLCRKIVEGCPEVRCQEAITEFTLVPSGDPHRN